MNQWKLLTLVGRDQTGIVARITRALYQCGATLGKASMMRLGGNFTMMLMLQTPTSIDSLCEQLKPVVETLKLNYHFQEIEVDTADHPVPDIRVSVYGADKPGIVADVTSALLELEFNILDLESDVAGSDEQIYIMHIEGTCSHLPEEIEQAIRKQTESVDIEVSAIDTMIG